MLYRKAYAYAVASAAIIAATFAAAILTSIATPLQREGRQMQPSRFAPIVERMIAETAAKVPYGLERWGAFHADRLPCGAALYLLPCRSGRVFAMRAYIADDDFLQIAWLAHDAKLAIRDAAGDPLYTRMGRIVWRAPIWRSPCTSGTG